VLGLDNAPLALPVAGVGSRVLAAFLDGLFQMLLQIAWLIASFAWAARSSAPDAWRFVLWAAGAFAIDWAYYAGSEIAMHGRTLGKKIVGLRVVAGTGGAASTGSLLTRNLLRTVDVLVGVPLMILDPLSRRLGDRLAGTVVVHDHAARDEPLLRRVPRGWQADDVAVVESLLRRAGDLEAARANAMAERVLERLEREEPGFLDGARGGDGPIPTLRRAFGVAGS
jgi:uncharacterized RDD family membrane protein YckC